jgi:hypothetical protein
LGYQLFDPEVWENLKVKFFLNIKTLPDNYVLRAWSPLVLLAKRPLLSYPFKEVVNEMVNHRTVITDIRI